MRPPRLGRLAGALACVAGALVVTMTAQAVPAGALSAGASRLDFAHDLEDSIGAPQGGNNDAVIVAWEAAEGGGTFTSPAYNNVAKYNPLNTTLNEPGSYSINNLGGGHGVQAYSSWTVGLAATHDSLAANAYGYPAIVSALKANAPTATTIAAITASSWCGCGAVYGQHITALLGGGGGGTVVTTGAAQCNVLYYPSNGYTMATFACNLPAGSGLYNGLYVHATWTGNSGYDGRTYGWSTTSWYGANGQGCSAQGNQQCLATNGGGQAGYTVTALGSTYGGNDIPFTVVTSGTASQTGGPTAPPYPTSYYAGGQPGAPSLPTPPAPVTSSPGGTGSGGVALPAAGTPLCSRSMPQAQTSPVVFFGGVARTQGVNYSYSWAWGDGTTPGTGFNDQHTYTATMPANGWTAVLTVTATGDGVTYAATTSTSTCSLRVDFNNPANSLPGSTGSGDQSACPSGWSWLNPSALLDIVPCLFVPSQATITSLGHLGDQAKTTIPFSYINDVSTFLPNAIGAIQSALSFGNVVGGSGTARNCLTPGHVNGGPYDPLAGTHGGAPGDTYGGLCLTAKAQSMGLPLAGVRGIILITMMCSWCFGLWRLIGRTIG